MERNSNIDYTRTHDLTIEEIKACSAFANMTDEEAREVIVTLKLLTKIAYDAHKKVIKNDNFSRKNRTLKA
ncbi:MAG TPA: hypothetical protein VHA56_07290 [Mucilaginibacter sp.]|nr:hypothetical protein [Mucilaginibacter sp.]